MYKIVQTILKYLTKWYLAKKKPKIIAITGSVGKTTTRKAITMVVEMGYETRRFDENSYNTELGLPLYILGQKSPRYKAFWGWVILRGIFEILFGEDYDILVVEMGADKPGDIEYLTSFVKPDVSVVTRVAATHLEEFRSVENILKEKEKIVKVLGEKDTAILNNDDTLTMSMKDNTDAKIITYGICENCDVYPSNIQTSIKGTKFVVHAKGDKCTIKTHAVAQHLIYPVLAAVAVGVTLDYSLSDMVKVLENFNSVKGRMRVIKGIKDSIILDDSYNSNPVSASVALESLRELAPERKVAVLGTMNEMGNYYKRAHREVGEKVSKCVDVLVAVGEGGKIIADTAKQNGLSSNSINVFKNSEEAGDFLVNFLKSKDTVLIKGSQNKVRLEKTVKRVMKDKSKAEDLLVRQTGVWKDK